MEVAGRPGAALPPLTVAGAAQVGWGAVAPRLPASRWTAACEPCREHQRL